MHSPTRHSNPGCLCPPACLLTYVSACLPGLKPSVKACLPASPAACVSACCPHRRRRVIAGEYKHVAMRLCARVPTLGWGSCLP